jgi:hypothetical protein
MDDGDCAVRLVFGDIVKGGVESTDPGRLRKTPSMKAFSARREQGNEIDTMICTGFASGMQ